MVLSGSWFWTEKTHWNETPGGSVAGQVLVTPNSLNWSIPAELLLARVMVVRVLLLG